MISNMKTSKLSQFYTAANIDNSDTDSESKSSGSESNDNHDAYHGAGHDDLAQVDAERDNDSDSSDDLQDEANELLDDEECEEEESKVNKINFEGKLKVNN